MKEVIIILAIIIVLIYMFNTRAETFVNTDNTDCRKCKKY